METRELEIVGLVPMAGRAARLGPLPCSKEILPVGMRVMPDGSASPKVLAHYLLEHFAEAGIRRAFLVVGADKWDVARYLTRAPVAGVELAFLGIEDSPGAPFSLDCAYGFVENAVCALGFPDILLPSGDPYRPLIDHMNVSGADVVLGLYSAEDPKRSDMVGLDSTGRVHELVPKPSHPVELNHTWSVAVWRPSFTHFMHQLLAPAAGSAAARRALLDGTGRSELHVGDVVNHARRAGLRCDGVVVSEDAILDAGTPVSWSEAVRRLSETPTG